MVDGVQAHRSGHKQHNHKLIPWKFALKIKDSALGHKESVAVVNREFDIALVSFAVFSVHPYFVYHRGKLTQTVLTSACCRLQYWVRQMPTGADSTVHTIPLSPLRPPVLPSPWHSFAAEDGAIR